MKKIDLVVVLVFLSSAIAWSQTIPQALQGSWGANGSQAVRINADGSGEWGDGNLAQSATFRVTGNTLRVQAMNMDGQMQWRVDGNSLFLTNPTGFLGELLIAVMKNGGVDRLTRIGASSASGNTANTQQYDPEIDFEVKTINGGKGVEITKYVGSKSTVRIPQRIRGLPITSIGEGAFAESDSLVSVTIPNSVTSIGAFAFFACESLTSVTIPISVTSIEDGAFSSCVRLTAINVAANNANYNSDQGVLYNKNKTKLIQYPGGKDGGFTIPNSVTSIGDEAFSYCVRLTNVTIPNSVTNIGKNAFDGCSNLTSVTIHNGVTSIGSSAFYGCTSLTSITIPDSVTSIGELAFFQTSLISITIPNSVASIGTNAFNCGKNFIAINVATNNTNYSSDQGVLYNKNKTTIIRYPQGKSGAFNIPNGVTSIGISAFYGCTSLTSVTIPNSVTSIGETAFTFCTDLTSIIIPNSVISIGYAFSNCRNLNSVTFQGTIGSSSFASYSFPGDLREKYLAGGIGTYKTSNPGDKAVWTKQ